MKKRNLLAGGVLAVAAVIGGNEAVVQQERAAAVAEFHQAPAAEYAKRSIGEEIKSLRAENVETFKAPPTADGKSRFQSRIYAGKRFWKDADADTLRPLDLTVREISALARLNPLRTHDKFVDAGPYMARWMNDAPGNFRMETGGLALEYRAIHDAKGVTVTTEPTARGMKETLTLADADAAHTLRWVIETDGSLVAQADNGYDVRAKDGSTPMQIERPRAWDAAGKPVMAVASVEGDTLTFKVTVLPGQEYPVTVDPTTVVLTKTGTTGSTISNYQSATYATTRNATSGGAVGGTLSVGQDSSAFNYEIYRIWLAFPLKGSQISSVSACSLKVYGSFDNSTTDFELYLHGANSARPTVTTADFDQFDGWQSSGAYNGTILNNVFNTSSFTVGAWNSLILTEGGEDSVEVAKEDTLWVALISKEDFSNSAPVGGSGEWVTIAPSGSGYAPYLSMTSEVDDGSATSVSITSVAGYPESLAVTFNDRAYSETGFALVNAVTETRIGGTDSIGAVSGIGGTGTIRMGGLLANTSYAWKVKQLGGAGDGLLSAADSCYTRANTPGKPTVTFPADSLLKFILDVNSNPAYTEFAIQDSVSGLYVHWYTGVPDSFKAGAEWRTYANWGGAAGDTVAAEVGKKKVPRAKARSGQ